MFEIRHLLILLSKTRPEHLPSTIQSGPENVFTFCISIYPGPLFLILFSLYLEEEHGISQFQFQFQSSTVQSSEVIQTPPWNLLEVDSLEVVLCFPKSGGNQAALNSMANHPLGPNLCGSKQLILLTSAYQATG